jgi:hypothetical protein
LFIDAIGLVCEAAPPPVHSPLGRAPPAADPRFGARNRIAATAERASAGVVPPAIGSAAVGEPRPQAQYGIVVPRPAAAPAGAAPPAPGGERFAPPTFPDGARLWACTSAQDTNCDGRAASIAYCAARGLRGPVRNGSPASVDRGSAPVRNVQGAACFSHKCAVVNDLECSH